MERETLYSVAKHVRLQYLLHMWAIFSVANSQCGNFSIFQILREIKYGESRRLKSAGTECFNLVNLAFKKCETS